LEREKKRQHGTHADDALQSAQDLNPVNFSASSNASFAGAMPWQQVRSELLEIRELLALA
jgi:hypothetical protein